MTPDPHLGPFWFIRDGNGSVRLLAHAISLATAEPYGDRLTAPAGPYELWTAWRRGRPQPPVPELAPIIATDEYADWPRGRIVFDIPTSRFVIYADRSLLTAPYLGAICAHFQLPPPVDARPDPHYCSTRRLHS